MFFVFFEILTALITCRCKIVILAHGFYVDIETDAEKNEPGKKILLSGLTFLGKFDGVGFVSLVGAE